MLEKKVEKVKHEQKPREDGVELENQFILRLPEEVASQLREALQTGNVKDRITIKMDNELRYGEVRFDHHLLHAKIVDLPTVVECLKTIDNKSFYKSADICQMMICKEEPDALDSEKESPNKGKKKDNNKVDKKFLWPHGITPPCKNVRKRRFRKTLKKKNIEAPEIEKEVKRLLRIDNDAVKVEYEIINEDVDKSMIEDHASKGVNEGDVEFNDETLPGGDKSLNDSSSQKDINVESDDEDMPSRPSKAGGLGEHDIFGGEVSSSEDEDMSARGKHLRELEDNSRMSQDDSRMSDYSLSAGGGGNSSNRPDATEFDKSMFGSPKVDIDDSRSKMGSSYSNLVSHLSYYEDQKRNYSDDDYSNDAPNLTPAQINAKIDDLRRQVHDIKEQHKQKSEEISTIQNQTLKQRMQEALDNMLSQIVEKELEIKDYENML